MRFPDPDTLRDNARKLRREELGRIARAGAIEWSTLVLRARIFLSRPTCPAPAPNHRPA